MTTRDDHERLRLRLLHSELDRALFLDVLDAYFNEIERLQQQARDNAAEIRQFCERLGAAEYDRDEAQNEKHDVQSRLHEAREAISNVVRILRQLDALPHVRDALGVLHDVH